MKQPIHKRQSSVETPIIGIASLAVTKCDAQKNILIVMLQIVDNMFHYKNIVIVQWIKRLKLCMVTMATLPPAKELKIQVVSWQNEIRILDVLKSPTWHAF